MGYNEDFEIFRGECLEYMANKNRNILEKWCKEIGYNKPIGYYNDLSKYIMVIYTTNPGILIGKGGKSINILEEMLKEKFHHEYKIEFVEIRGDIVNYNTEK